ncbi:hypothetical protein C3L33_01049, partial [Rhododendron williamsianum]
MGCLVSTPKDLGGNRRRPANVGEISVFVPGLRIPKPVDFSPSLTDHVSKTLVERLSALRTRIVVMAGQEGGSTLADLQQALEDYLPFLLGLVKDGSPLQQKVQFVWVNQEDDAEETAMSNAWYEVLSVLHLMASLSLSQANLCCYLLFDVAESRRTSIDVLLKAAGYLDCAVRQVLPLLPTELRRGLPVDLTEGVLRALCLQALGQGVDIQLGLAIDSTKATLAVKRRLACEMVKYWQQAQDNLTNLPLSNGWGEKHRFFVKWKYIEAKAAAYYYHGLILDEGNTEKSHGMAVAALQAADEFLKESKKTSDAFNTAPPLSRSEARFPMMYDFDFIDESKSVYALSILAGGNLSIHILGVLIWSRCRREILEFNSGGGSVHRSMLNPPLWGTMKYLSEKIPKDTSSKVRINQDLYSHDKIMETAPTLPDFALALKPDDYQLPLVHISWNDENVNRGQ